MSSGNIILDSLIRIRRGFLIEFLTSVIALVSLYFVFYTFILRRIVSVSTGIIFSTIELATLLEAILFIIGVIALVYQYEGFKGLEKFIQNASLGKIGVILAVVGGVLSFFANIIGLVLSLVGMAIVGIVTFDIGDYYHNSLAKAGGIIIIIPYANIVGFLLAYLGFGDIIKNVKQGAPPSLTVSMVPNTGTLKGNVAYVYVYSNSTAKILSALLEDVQIYAMSITPDILNPGNNYLMITFPQPLPNLKPGNNYRVRLNLDNNSYVEVIVTYQQ
ncbi:MAG: DUF973 family protein [Sulfolobus sp.]|nr:DUF973 family protein [Sulfolobus sp.]